MHGFQLVMEVTYYLIMCMQRALYVGFKYLMGI